MQVVEDVKALYTTVVPPKSCSAELKKSYMIALAKANYQTRRLAEQQNALTKQVALWTHNCVSFCHRS